MLNSNWGLKMKKINLIALILSATLVLPVYAQGIATVKQIEWEKEEIATKTVLVTREEAPATVAPNGEIKLNDVIDSENKKITVKMQNGAVLKLVPKTKLSVVEYKNGKAVYELLEGEVNYLSQPKTPDAIIRLNKKDYVLGASVDIAVSYDKEKENMLKEDTLKDSEQTLKNSTVFSKENVIYSFAVYGGSFKVGTEVVKKGFTAKVDLQGNVEVGQTVKKRGIRG